LGPPRQETAGARNLAMVAVLAKAGSRAWPAGRPAEERLVRRPAPSAARPSEQAGRQAPMVPCWERKAAQTAVPFAAGLRSEPSPAAWVASRWGTGPARPTSAGPSPDFGHTCARREPAAALQAETAQARAAERGKDGSGYRQAFAPTAPARA